MRWTFHIFIPQKTTHPDTYPQTHVLILNTRQPSNEPIITDATGLDDRFFYFKYEENTEAYGSCGLTFQNQFYMFGGNSKRTQISQIVNCELKRIGQLPFTFEYGACTNVANQKFYLCFDWNDYRQCYEASSPTGTFKAISKSGNDHRYTRIASSDGKII